jgi:hypothetical protein
MVPALMKGRERRGAVRGNVMAGAEASEQRFWSASRPNGDRRDGRLGP